MTRIKQCIAIFVLCALSIGILSGFSDYEIATLAAENNEAVENAVVGANNVILSVGTFQSETGLTSELSENEVQAQADLYDESVDTYFSPEYPAYNDYTELNDYYLNDVFSEVVDYQVSGGVADSKLVSVTYSANGTEANAEVYLQVYNTSVVGNDDGSYSIVCTANVVQAIADVQKIEDKWKVKSMELNIMEDWLPEDSINSSGTATLAESAMDSGYQTQVASETAASYDSFQSARDVASEISIQKCCTIGISDVIDINAETETNKS